MSVRRARAARGMGGRGRSLRWLRPRPPGSSRERTASPTHPGPLSQSRGAAQVQIKKAGEHGVCSWVWEVIDPRSVVKMWRVKNLNVSLSSSPQPVSKRTSGTERAGSGLRGGDAGVCGEGGVCGVYYWSCRFSATGVEVYPSYCPRASWRGKTGRAGPGWPDPGFLTLSAFSGKTSYESSSSRTYPAARCLHQLWKRAPDMLLADLSTVQAGIAGEIRLASFSTGLFAEVESSEEQRAKAGT